ncbi:MAG: alanine racemase [Aquificae bacterium]|nr:alanine racemase [Aquificota bacterium]
MARALLTISRSALLENVKNLASFSNKKVIAVVKADAYGVGARLVAPVLGESPFVDAFAVACAQEGALLREAGVKKKVLVLGGLLEDELELFTRYELTPVVSDEEQLRLARRLGLPFHVKYDTGMGRLGFTRRLVKHKLVEGVMTHLSSPADREFTLKQIKSFARIVKAYRGVWVHLESSAGLVYRVPFATHVRVGLALYGEKPLKDYPVKLVPALTLKARVVSVKRLKAGHPVSYGRTFVTKKPTRVAVVAFGYADGFAKSLSNRGYFLWRGHRLPVLGAVTMDLTVVGLGSLPVKPGDWVTVVSPERSFTELARDAGTIPYELMCNLSPRVERKLVP